MKNDTGGPKDESQPVHSLYTGRSRCMTDRDNDGG